MDGLGTCGHQQECSDEEEEMGCGRSENIQVEKIEMDC